MCPLKPESRIVGFDDSKFAFSDELVHVFGVVTRANGYVEGAMHDQVHVDGNDATEVLIQLVLRSRYRKQLRLILTDGIAMGGFNIIDIEKLNKMTGIPVIAVTRSKPDLEAMKKAMTYHFDDWEERFKTIAKGTIHELDLGKDGHKPIHIKSWGLDDDTDAELVGSYVRASIIRGAYPEPLRLAHMISTALTSGESKGRA